MQSVFSKYFNTRTDNRLTCKRYGNMIKQRFLNEMSCIYVIYTEKDSQGN
jgi:hypothetical protein